MDVTVEEKIAQKKAEADAAWVKLERLLKRESMGQGACTAEAELSRLQKIDEAVQKIHDAHEAHRPLEAPVGAYLELKVEHKIADMTQEQLLSEIEQAVRESDEIEEELKNLQAERGAGNRR
jgi:hypothetical protein